MTVTFTVPGKPQGKGRPRFMKNGRAYTPKSTRAYEDKIRGCYLLQYGYKFAADKPIRLRVSAYFPIPKGTKKAERGLMSQGLIQPRKKPDGDNIEKAVADALNGTAYEDDRQIVSARWEKLYVHDPGSEGYLIVTVEDISGECESNDRNT